jgi:transposase
MKKKRRKFTDEFKDEAVKLVLEQGYQISEAARNLGIHPNLLGRWKQEYEDSDKGGSDLGSVVAMRAELSRLRKENKRLKIEREILKRAATFFAKESG